MELTPTSPIDPDSELVPSSQTQELYYSQAVDFNSFNKITVPPRWAFLTLFLLTLLNSPNTVGPGPRS